MPNAPAPWQLRRNFANRLSEMYRSEVPAYELLTDIVSEINAETSTNNSDDSARLGQERHGAIRLADASELSLIRRAFKILGMHPVGYYDLSPAGIPVHSTAFRPITSDEMDHSAFRVFVSLVRIEQINSEALQRDAKALVTKRALMQPEAVALIEKFETAGCLTVEDSERFLELLMDTFRWRGEAISSLPVYNALLEEHPLLADVVCFPNPHINHLTPRVTDIDFAHRMMKAKGLPIKTTIEGPPARTCPILLRQTAFRALAEEVNFPDEHGQYVLSNHTARFGEIESRGAALTPDGMKLYDSCLVSGAFERIADDYESLRREKLAWFRYKSNDRDLQALDINQHMANIEDLIAAGQIYAVPITYEDFLPVSAAGIFQSNLVRKSATTMKSSESGRAEFEQALGCPVFDMHDLYRKESERSIRAIFSCNDQGAEMAHG